tara:strand:+ start:1325 stop:1660 length:336 start_codon:yes stop_codon:yes gene_type:complete
LGLGAFDAVGPISRSAPFHDFGPADFSDPLGIVFGGAEGVGRERLYGEDELPGFSFELPFSRITQGSADDKRTINRAREIIDVVNNGEATYGAIPLESHSLNCIGFGYVPR